MIKVLLVDDDILTLNRVRGLVDWPRLGYEIAGQAMDGEAALRVAEQVVPDLVILDVNMPRKDGISTMRDLKARWPGIYVLVLSNHDTFEYVRQAMRLGAFDYLLKHALSAEVLLRKLAEIEEDRKRHALNAQHDHGFARVAKQQHLRELLVGGVADGQRHALIRAQPEFSAHQSVLAVMRILNLMLFTCFDGEGERVRLQGIVADLCNNVLTNVQNGLVTALDNGDFALLFTFDQTVSSRDARVQADTYLQMVRNNARRMLNIALVYQCCEPVTDVQFLHGVCKLALERLDEEHGAPRAATDTREHKDLMEALEALDGTRVEAAIAVLAERGGGTLQTLLPLSVEWGSAHGVVLQDAYIRLLQNALRTPLPNEALCVQVQEHYRVLMTHALEARFRLCSPPVLGAIAFIHAHYMRDISLSAVAEHVGVSDAHLSRQFRREMGVSFVDYLTAHRIRTAQELLKHPGVTISQVGRRVGFPNYSYFLRVFKKATGHTITQAAQQRAGEEADR